MIHKDELIEDIRRLGIAEGDLLTFHSSLKSLGTVEGGAETVLSSFMEVVGSEGTLVLPTFTLSGGAGDRLENWYVHDTPSTVGRITEIFRKQSGVLRSDHFSHSYAAKGKLTHDIVSDHKNAYGRSSMWGEAAFGINSPLDKLHRYNAKYLFVGVDYSIATAFHFVETLYREYLIETNRKACPWMSIDFMKMGRRIEETGLVHRGSIGEAECKWFWTRDLVDQALLFMKQQPAEFLAR